MGSASKGLTERSVSSNVSARKKGNVDAFLLKAFD